MDGAEQLLEDTIGILVAAAAIIGFLGAVCLLIAAFLNRNKGNQ